MPIGPANNSDLNRTTIDEELYAGDVGAVVGGEEYGRLGEIVRRKTLGNAEADAGAAAGDDLVRLPKLLGAAA